MPRVPYESEHFPPRATPNGTGELNVSWGEILWAAMTVGRPNRAHAFQHGMASLYEAMFRVSLVRMALEQSSPFAYRLRRTDAFRTLDPTEKGAVSYFLGMTFCKLFATKLLNAPWLLHLDVYRPRLNAVLTGRSRPDLIGQEVGNGPWHAFESKGRASPPDNTVKTKAKSQANRVVSVSGSPCQLHVGSVTYFRNEVLHFYWCDPAPEVGPAVRVDLQDADWRHYYLPVTKLYNAVRTGARQPDTDPDTVRVEEADISISLHASVSAHVLEGRWRQALAAANEARTQLQADDYRPDGIKVVAGDSWLRPFLDPGEQER
jgi:hypothetical protein